MNERDPRTAFREWWQSLAGEQRFSLSVFGFCAILTLALSVAYIRSGILSPFLVSKETLKASEKILAKQGEQERKLNELKAKDTDRDGLSDYAELYLYKTSPYLSDTDSDGSLDAIEIAQGSDPNCPQGTNCLQLADASPDRSTSTLEAFLQPSEVDSAAAAALGANDPGVIGAQNFIQTAPDPSTVGVGQVRDILLSNQLITASSLEGLPDEQVMQIYNAAYAQVLKIREAQATGQAPTP